MITDPLFLDLQHGLVGEYSLERELGRGGMGVVYLARDVQLDRLVAIKALPRELATREDIRARFLREARTAARLSHPHIVPIHRVGEADGLPYFVMTFIDGGTLGERLRARGPMAPAAMIRILHEVAQALGYAHGRGVIHRDVKPDNILLEGDGGRALVSDFGIASRADDPSAAGEAVMGTAQFMSPEQMRGEPLDGRSDLYSLGVVAFLALSGTLPIDAPSLAALMLRRETEDAPPLASVAPTLPAVLTRIVDSCLHRQAARRFADAETLAAALMPPSAQVPKPTLPIALRLWAQQPTPFAGMYAAWSIGLTAVALGFGGVHAGSTPRLLLLATAPIVPVLVFQLRKAYRALAAGYTLADLRHALRSWRTARLEELTPEAGDLNEHLWARQLRWLAFGAIGATVASTVARLIIFDFHPHFGLHLGWRAVLSILTRLKQAELLGLLVGVAGGAGLGAMGVPIMPPRLQRATAGRLRGWFWNGPAGAWMAARLTPANRAIAAADFRPTEMALGVAVGDLFAALPTVYRESLADLPEIVERLTERATALRTETARLQPLLENPDHAGTDALSTRANQRKRDLAETVTALERIRMDLLRLHGGIIDLRPVTTTLDAARRVASDIGRLDAAQRELAPPRRPIPIDLHTPTPA